MFLQEISFFHSEIKCRNQHRTHKHEIRITEDNRNALSTTQTLQDHKTKQSEYIYHNMLFKYYSSRHSTRQY